MYSLLEISYLKFYLNNISFSPGLGLGTSAFCRGLGLLEKLVIVFNNIAFIKQKNIL
jgi:hypothetical protein